MSSRRGHWTELSAGAAAADELLAIVAPELVLKKDDPLVERGFLNIIRALAAELSSNAGSAEAKALKDAFDALDVNWPSLSEAKREAAIKSAETIIGAATSQIGPSLGPVFQKHGALLVASTRGAMIDRYELPIGAALTDQDQKIVDHAATSQALYVTDQYGRLAASVGQQARDVVAAGMREGLGRNDIGGDLYGVLGQQLGRSRAYFNNVASIHMGRARSYAQLAGLDEAGIEEWMFSSVLDERTCFAPGTRVMMASGHWKNIENVFGGDMVMSCKGRPRQVLRQIEKTGRKWYTFRIEGVERRLVVTHNHGVLTAKGWMRAGSVQLGDELVLYRRDGEGAAPRLWVATEREWMARPGRFDGRTLNDVEPWPHPYLHRLATKGAVRRIWASDLSRRTPAFDLEVEEDAGYIAEGVIVHNSPICRMMNGRTFSTGVSLARYQQVAQRRPEAVKDLQPFVNEGVDDDGNAVLYYKDGDKRVTVAQVDDRGMARDNPGKFSRVAPRPTLEQAGIGPPPLHGHCRSLLVPA